MSGEKLPLRIISYLVPSLPVELFEAIAQYLEAELNWETVLSVESRFNGPQAGRCDLFKDNVADLAFITGAAYQELKNQKNTDWELLPVGAVHNHCVKGENLGYFADVVIHPNTGKRVKDLWDLRGGNWASNQSSSLSGHLVMLKLLREKGENVSFFGNVLISESHTSSVQMVAQRKVDVTCVDSVALACYLAKNPLLKSDIEILDSVGPLPPHPLMVRASLTAERKKSIADALLRIPQTGPWNERFSSFNLVRFASISDDVYYSDREIRDQVAKLSASVCYY